MFISELWQYTRIKYKNSLKSGDIYEHYPCFCLKRNATRRDTAVRNMKEQFSSNNFKENDNILFGCDLTPRYKRHISLCRLYLSGGLQIEKRMNNTWVYSLMLDTEMHKWSGIRFSVVFRTNVTYFSEEQTLEY